MNTRILADDYKIVKGNALAETALSGVSALPASGSYIDTRGHDLVHIIAHLGTVHASDAPVFEPKAADAADGTLDQLDSDLAHTVAADDDGEFVVWTLETRKLPEDHPFVALAVSGTVANGSYVDVTFLLAGRSLPVAQDTSQLPDASTYAYVG